MPAATLEHSSKDHAPVFVSGGRRRTHAVRVAAATLGLLLAGWLGALAGGLIGFSPFPKLALPGTGAARTAPADRASQPAAKRDANVNASPIARVPASSGHNEASRAQSSASPGASRGGTGGGGSGAGRRPAPEASRAAHRRPRRTPGAAALNRSPPRPPPAPRRTRAPGTHRRSRRRPAVRRVRPRRAATPPTRREGRSPPIRRARQRVHIRAEAARARPPRRMDRAMSPVIRRRSEAARRVGRRIERPPAHWSLLALLLGSLLLLLGAQGLSTATTGRSATATTGAGDPALHGSAAVWRIEGERLVPSEAPVGRRVALTFDDGPDPRWTPRIAARATATWGSRPPSSWSVSTSSATPAWSRRCRATASSSATTPSTTWTWPRSPAGSATSRCR